MLLGINLGVSKLRNQFYSCRWIDNSLDNSLRTTRNFNRQLSRLWGQYSSSRYSYVFWKAYKETYTLGFKKEQYYKGCISYKSRNGILVRLSAMWKTKRHYCAVRMVSVSCVLNFRFNSKDNCTMLLTSFEVFRCSIARPRYKDFALKYSFFNLLSGDI